MSRSKKRSPYFTDYGSRKVHKPLASRRFRKKVRQTLTPWKYTWNQVIIEKECYLGCECENFGYICPYQHFDLEPEFPHPKWMTNPYTVCDFRFYAPWDARAYRK